MDLLQLLLQVLSMLVGIMGPSSWVSAYRVEGGVVVCFVNPKEQYTVAAVDLGGRYVLPPQLAVYGRAERHGDKVVVPRGGFSKLYVKVDESVEEVVLWAEPKNLRLKVKSGDCPDE